MLRKIRPIFLALSALLVYLGVHAASRVVVPDSRWTQHSSFDNLPRRIVESQSKIYYFVYQHPYAPGHNIYNEPISAVFVYDKARPEAGLTDLHRLAPLSATDVNTFTVDPDGDVLAFSYTDGGIDVVGPDHSVHFIDNVALRNFPGASSIRHASFDRNRRLFWFSTNSGYLTVSADNYSVVRDISWRDTVTDINSVGDRVIAIIGGKIHQAEYAHAARRNAFSELKTLTVSGPPLRVLPMDSRRFLYVTDAGIVYLATLSDEDVWTSRQIISDSNILNPQNNTNNTVHQQYLIDRLEHNCTPMADGWVIATHVRAYLVQNGENGADPVVTNRVYPKTFTRHTTTADGVTFRFYRERGEFIFCSFENGRWGEYSEPIRPDAPLICSATAFAYSPVHGLITTNVQNAGENCPWITSAYLPTLMTAYKDGHWRNLGGPYNRPYYADENGTFASKWASNVIRWPVSEPRGLAVDPLFPDWVHMGSTQSGFASYNVEDPRKFPVITIPPSLWMKDFPSCTDMWKSSWMTCCHSLGADGNGNIWMFHVKSWPWDGPESHNITLKCLTPENRRAALENSDPSQLEWITFDVPLDFVANYQTNGIVTKHPRNHGTIIMSTNPDLRTVMVYDTKNTIDPADDVLREFCYIRTPDGARQYFNIITAIVEDPDNGNIYIFSDNGAWQIDVNTEFEYPCIDGRRIDVKSAEGMDSEVLGWMAANAACIDTYGRLWIGTSHAGVVGIDTKDMSLVTHYSTANSPIPGNAVFGLGWNPDTNSLFISTTHGIAEVRPDAPGRQLNALQEPYVMPGHVDAGYTGVVNVRNVPEGLTLSVLDADGRQVALLPQPRSGVTHWNLRDKEGNRVGAGLYRVADSSRSTEFPSLTVIVK